MFLSRRSLLPVVFGGLLVAQHALAGDKSGFVQAEFDAAQKAGKPILVEISAPWCPTCKAQAPILGELSAQPKFKDLRVFAVDFDNQKDVVKSLKAQSQSTLIVFKGGNEVGRSVGDTKRDSIEALLTKAL